MNDVLDFYEPTRALETRIIILEAALAAIGRECETVLEEPSVVFMTTCRIGALARQALAKPKRARGRTEEQPQSTCA